MKTILLWGAAAAALALTLPASAGSGDGQGAGYGTISIGAGATAGASGHASGGASGRRGGGSGFFGAYSQSSADLNAPIDLPKRFNAQSHGVSDAYLRARAYNEAVRLYGKGWLHAEAGAGFLDYRGKRVAFVNAWAVGTTRVRVLLASGQYITVSASTPIVWASARGGLHPEAWTGVTGITYAHARAGRGVDATGGTTVITKLPHGGKMVLTYTDHAYSAAIAARHRATAYSGYSDSQVYSGGTLQAAVQAAAYAYASADQTSAYGNANAGASFGARTANARVDGTGQVYASAYVFGGDANKKKQKQVLITISGGATDAKRLATQACTWSPERHGGPWKLYCHKVVLKPTT